MSNDVSAIEYDNGGTPYIKPNSKIYLEDGLKVETRYTEDSVTISIDRFWLEEQIEAIAKRIAEDRIDSALRRGEYSPDY